MSSSSRPSGDNLPAGTGLTPSSHQPDHGQRNAARPVQHIGLPPSAREDDPPDDPLDVAPTPDEQMLAEDGVEDLLRTFQQCKIHGDGAMDPVVWEKFRESSTKRIEAIRRVAREGSFTQEHFAALRLLQNELTVVNRHIRKLKDRRGAETQQQLLAERTGTTDSIVTDRYRQMHEHVKAIFADMERESDQVAELLTQRHRFACYISSLEASGFIAFAHGKIGILTATNMKKGKSVSKIKASHIEAVKKAIAEWMDGPIRDLQIKGEFMGRELQESGHLERRLAAETWSCKSRDSRRESSPQKTWSSRQRSRRWRRA